MSTQLDIRRKINRITPVPYYYQIVQILREAIQDAGSSESDPLLTLPSEADFCELFEVNRGTIRHALQVLEREGLIYREKGRGTFLRRKRLEIDLAVLCSTTDDLKRRGWQPGAQVISLEQVEPSLHIQRSLSLPEGERTWVFYRLRLANNEPIGLEHYYLPCRPFPEFDRRNLSASLYFTIENNYGLQPRSADQLIRTRLATPQEAALLTITECEPVFEISRTTFDTTGVPLEYLESVWRGDRYDFRIHLHSRD